MSEEELKKKLTPEQYRVLREKGTEPAGSGKFDQHFENGSYKCLVCGNKLFESDTKYESSIPGLAGWPSFEDAIEGSVELKVDNSYGMHRTEVVCANCDSHLGHLFEGDKSSKTNKHYCINSVCLDFKPKTD